MQEEYGYNIILLGGTGAKCGEIILHMCANGYFGVHENLNILYIDSDTKNGNAQKFMNLYETYIKCRKQYVIEESPIERFFYTEVKLITVNPVGKYKQFKDIAGASGDQYESMITARALMQSLYSEEEMDLEIATGFYAHPNVGAAVFAANMDSIMAEFQQILQEEMGQMKNIKIFLMGSIFGGTGAASLPTIARYIKETLIDKSTNRNIQEQLKIGGCMVLPYFMFDKKDTNNKGNDPIIEADKFALKTKSALEYYKYVDEEEGRKTFDELYIIGHDAMDIRGKYAIAGVEQRNLPHVVELYAAMSAVTFFDNEMGTSGHYFAVVPAKKISGENIYKTEKGYSFFFIMMRFAIVMKSLIIEELFDYTQKDKLSKYAHKIPWYYDFLNGKAESQNFEGGRLYSLFGEISNYCDEYIRWFAELNLDNIDKQDMVGIDYDEDKGDIVNYLSFFSKELLFRQYQNNQIRNGSTTLEDNEAKNTYKSNLKYIRKNLGKLEDVHFYTDHQSEKIGMNEIWNRISNMGFNSFVKDEGAFKNIAKSNNKTMESGVKNLINAIFCACLF